MVAFCSNHRQYFTCLVNLHLMLLSVMLLVNMGTLMHFFHLFSHINYGNQFYLSISSILKNVHIKSSLIMDNFPCLSNLMLIL